MTNRKLAYIVREQHPILLLPTATVQDACKAMCEHRAGSVLVVDDRHRLLGIFSGRDAVQFLAGTGDATAVVLADVMTRNPFCLGPESRAVEALSAMTAGAFRHIPVVDDGRVCGVVSRGDFKGMEFEEFNWIHWRDRTGYEADRPVTDVIKDRLPLTFPGHVAVQDACRAMVESGKGAVLVLDEQERLKGIFTGRDALRAAAGGSRCAKMRLDEAMKAEPITIAAGARAVDALRIMSDGGFRHLPVVEDGKIRGLVARSDFTGLEIDRLDEDEHLAECIW